MNSADPVELCITGLSTPLAMYVHGPEDQHVSRKIREEGIWEPYETSLIVSRLGAGDVFVDVGANIGYFTVVAASLVGESGQVFAFEPDPENYILLKKNCTYNSLQTRVHAVRAGLSSEDRAGSLYLSGDNLGDHQIYASAEKREQLSISLLQGASYLRGKIADTSLNRIDLIKVDTQGSEFEVMAGLMPLLQELAKVPSMIIELTPYSLRQAGSSGRALIELLADLKQNFWIVDHIEHRLVKSSARELAQWCDDVDSVAGDEGFMNIYVGSGECLRRTNTSQRVVD